jgi:hypothetical protein
MNITFKNMKDAGLGAWIVAIVLLIVVVLVHPFINFWISYFVGWVCTLVIGDVLTEALNTLFNTTRFTKDMLPMCAGALGWLGGFFYSARTSSKNKD